MTLRTARYRLAQIWHSHIVSRLLAILFVLFVLLTIYSLDQGRKLNEVRTVVQTQTVIGGSCNDARETQQGCRIALDRLLKHATPRQLEALRGEPGPQGETGPQGATGTRGATGARGATGPRGVAGATRIGPPGPVGPQGPRGAQGAAGPQGATGLPGRPGASGSAGANGNGVSIQLG